MHVSKVCLFLLFWTIIDSRILSLVTANKAQIAAWERFGFPCEGGEDMIEVNVFVSDPVD